MHAKARLYDTATLITDIEQGLIPDDVYDDDGYLLPHQEHLSDDLEFN